MRLIRDLLDRLSGTCETVTQHYEVTDEPWLVPAWRSPADGRQLYLRPDRVEATFLRYGKRYGKGPWRFRELAVVGDIVGTGLHGARVKFRRCRDVPQWAVEALTPPDELVFVDIAVEDARRRAEQVVAHVVADEPRRAYFQLAMTWDEALEKDREHGGEVWQVKAAQGEGSGR